MSMARVTYGAYVVLPVVSMVRVLFLVVGASWGTRGRSRSVMWCFCMRHFAPWWMTVVCVGLASFGASTRVSGGTGPISGGTGSCFAPVGA